MLIIRYIIIFISLFFYVGPVYSQTIESLKDIVSFQQEKIARIEDNLKKLVGLIEEQTKINNTNDNLKTIEKQINNINEKLILFENNIKNITNLTYDLDFAVKRVERHLQLSSIKSIKDKADNKVPKDIGDFKIEKKADIIKNDLDPKTNNVLGFVKEQSSQDKNISESISKNNSNKKKDDNLLTKGSAEENFNYALDLANQFDFVNAEKALKQFIIKHKESVRIADAQYWLGRVYFAQKKFEEATIALSEFNIVFPNDPRYQDSTLLIAESAVNFAPQDKLCNILNQLSENMVNPTKKFVKKINFFKNDKQCSPE